MTQPASASAVVSGYLDPGSGDSGSQIAAFLLAFVVVLAVLLLLVWLVRRANSRPCPRCGSRVRTGNTRCESCGFDFETVGRGAPS